MPRVSPTSATPATIATKSITFKQVALAPPGTVLKPFVETVEENNKGNLEAQDEEAKNNAPIEVRQHEDDNGNDEDCGSSNCLETASQEEDKTCDDSGTDKPVEVHGSKLSAAAEPFSPVTSSTNHPMNNGAVAGVYYLRACEGIPYGPRSHLCYRMHNSFHIIGGLRGYEPPEVRNGNSPPRIMNPDAPEFVPRRALLNDQREPRPSGELPLGPDAIVIEKDNAEAVDGKGNELDEKPNEGSMKTEKPELARQMLRSFILNSVQNTMDPSNDPSVEQKKGGNLDSSDAVSNNSAIIKIHHGNHEKEKPPASGFVHKVQANGGLASQVSDNSEGFIVEKRCKRNRQELTDDVIGLYNQQSLCASVRQSYGFARWSSVHN